MAEEHPNVSLFDGMDPADLGANPELFAPDVVFHYFNPRLADVQGDYVGADGIRLFFETIGSLTGGTFQVDPVSITAIGDELVVMHTKNRMTIGNQSVVTDVVLVWRILGGRIVEVWDIPSVGAEVLLPKG